jgi:hypothetical protein
MTRPAVALVVDVLATYRLTRLAQRDTFPPVVKAREAILTKDRPEWVWDLGDCAWCLSFWIGLGVMAARRLAPGLWRPLAAALAASAVTGLVTDHELRMEHIG